MAVIPNIDVNDPRYRDQWSQSYKPGEFWDNNTGMVTTYEALQPDGGVNYYGDTGAFQSGLTKAELDAINAREQKAFNMSLLAAAGVATAGAAWGGMGAGAAGGAGAGGAGGLSPLAATNVGSFGGVTGVTAGGSGLLGTAGAAASSLIPGISNQALIKGGGALLGGLANKGGGSGADGQTSGKREPWGPAQPYILDNLKDTAKLKDYYQKTPFNQQQQASLQNTFADLSNFRQNTAPGLMDFANRGMTNSYQRSPVGRPGEGAGYGGRPPQQGGQQAAPIDAQTAHISTGLQAGNRARLFGGSRPQGLLQPQQGPFRVNPGQQYGLLDFDAMNPFRRA